MTQLPEWAAPLGLEPHPEGGWYAETYRSATVVDGAQLGGAYDGPRCTATMIQYLLLPGERSAWHRVRSDELWLHQRGGRLRLMLGGDGEQPGSERELIVGPDPLAGQRLQALVPAGEWQAAEPLDEPVLVACLVTPGFEFADFALAAPSPGTA